MVLARNLDYAHGSADKTKTVLSEQNRTGISCRYKIQLNIPMTLSNTNAKNLSITKSIFV